MLVNINTNVGEYNALVARWEAMAKDEKDMGHWPYHPKQLSDGVYYAPLFRNNFDFAIKTETPFSLDSEMRELMNVEIDWNDEERVKAHQDNVAEFWRKYDSTPRDYGVCDDWEQIIAQWPEIVESERKFLIVLTWVTEMRPHKHGIYIGTNVEYGTWEYLSEHETIDGVYLFDIYEIKDEYAILP